MYNSTTGIIYTSQKDAYVKLFSINRNINYNEFALFRITQVQSNGAIDNINLNVYFGNDDMYFNIEDYSTNARLRVAYYPLKYTSTKQYILGDVVSYKGNIYILKGEASKNNSPVDNSQWELATNYVSGEYAKNSCVLYNNGKYYKSLENVSASDVPSISQKWEQVKGEYALYCAVLNSGNQINVKLLTGNSNFIKFYRKNAKICYTLDSAKETINSQESLIPRINAYSDNICEGIICPNKIMPSGLNNKTITPNNASGGNKYYKIATANLVKNTTLNFNIKIENLWFDTKNIVGTARVLLMGDVNNVNMILKPVKHTSDFSIDNINIEAWNNNGEINFYLVSASNSYKIELDGLVVFDKENTNINLGCGYVMINHNIEEYPTGTKIGSLF